MIRDKLQHGILDMNNDRKNYMEICYQFQKAGVPPYNGKHKFEPASPIAEAKLKSRLWCMTMSIPIKFYFQTAAL